MKRKTQIKKSLNTIFDKKNKNYLHTKLSKRKRLSIFLQTLNSKFKYKNLKTFSKTKMLLNYKYYKLYLEYLKTKKIKIYYNLYFNYYNYNLSKNINILPSFSLKKQFFDDYLKLKIFLKNDNIKTIFILKNFLNFDLKNFGINFYLINMNFNKYKYLINYLLSEEKKKLFFLKQEENFNKIVIFNNYYIYYNIYILNILEIYKLIILLHIFKI